MTTIHHTEHLIDRAAMLAVKAVVALAGERSFGVEARPAFDEMIARTPAAKGVTYEAATVGGVPGWWCRPAEVEGSGVILHFHGGAYVVGSAAAYRHYAGQIATRAKMPLFTADYALAPERPFPAATTDALAAYRGLVELGHERIAIAGDSAGGGLALSLLRAATSDASLPRPIGAMIMSPWTDLALTGTSIEGRAAADPLLKREMLADAATLYLLDRSRCIAAASPLYADLSGLPPVLIHVGDDEILLDDSLRYADRMIATGGTATVHVWAGMPHVFPANVGTLDLVPPGLEQLGEKLRIVERSNVHAVTRSFGETEARRGGDTSHVHVGSFRHSVGTSLRNDFVFHDKVSVPVLAVS